MSDAKSISLADMLSRSHRESTKIVYGYPPGWEAEAKFLITRQVNERVKYVESLAQPKTISEFINLADECLKDLDALAREYPDKISGENKIWLSNLDEAKKLIDGEVRAKGKRNENSKDEVPGGGGPNRPGRILDDPEEPWWKKLLETIVAFAKRLAAVAESIAKEAYGLLKAAVASAWSSFWKGVGEAVVTLIFTSLGGNLF